MNKKEIEIELNIRNIISEKVIPLCQKNNICIELLESKVVADIIICRNSETPKLFFLEVKHFNSINNRIGFGDRKGGGFQPEILFKRPKYFEENMRWVFCKENDNSYYIFSNEEICDYIMGNKIGTKQNNFKLKLFQSVNPFSEKEFIKYIFNWLIK